MRQSVMRCCVLAGTKALPALAIVTSLSRGLPARRTADWRPPRRWPVHRNRLFVLVESSYSTNLTGMALVRRRRRQHTIRYAGGSAVQSRGRARKFALVRDLPLYLKMLLYRRRP
jgi:hypothetical protein